MLDSQNQADATSRVGKTVDSYIDFFVAYSTIPGERDMLKICNN